MRILYTLAIYAYALGIQLATLWSRQASLWTRGRRGAFKRMHQIRKPGEKLVWFHCASLGEFEQGRSVIEAFREKFPDYQLLLTFFSPSGYQVRKHYEEVDYVFYLPLDTPKQVKRFLGIWKPQLVVFIKYEYWYNFLHELQKRNIPTIFVSVTFRPAQYFFQPYGAWFRKYLKGITHFFVQNQTSRDLLNKLGIGEVTVAGDTRFDRVNELSKHPERIRQVESFTNNNRVLVAGSTWEADEQLIASAMRNMNRPPKLIIAPHQIQESGLERLHQLFGENTVRFSAIQDHIPSGVHVVIIDGIGMLSHLYQYGQVAYIGGGFGKGIHNILEAATYGKPVFFGPNYKKFIEARELIERGGAMAVNSADELRQALQSMLSDDAIHSKASQICNHYIQEKTGATTLVINYIEKVLR